MKKYIFKYGVLGGLLASILGTLNWWFIARPFGVNVSETVGYLSIACSFLCIPFGQRYFRDKLNEGILSFGQSFKIGLGISFIGSVVMGLHSVIFFALQKEEFFEWQRSNLSTAELAAFNEKIAEMPEFAYTPWFQGIVMFVMAFLIGTLINVLGSLIIKRLAVTPDVA